MGSHGVSRFGAEVRVRTGYDATYLGDRTLAEHGLTVHVFRLRDHPFGGIAYAWGSSGCTVVVRPLPIDAEAAVQDAMRE